MLLIRSQRCVQKLMLTKQFLHLPLVRSCTEYAQKEKLDIYPSNVLFDKAGDGWMPIYRFKGMTFASLISRMKIGQTAMSLVMSPASFYLYSTGQCSVGWLVIVNCLAVFATAMLYAMTTLILRKLVGVVSIDYPDRKLKIPALIPSIDQIQAFDLLECKFIATVLKRYGFGQNILKRFSIIIILQADTVLLFALEGVDQLRLPFVKLRTPQITVTTSESNNIKNCPSCIKHNIPVSLASVLSFCFMFLLHTGYLAMSHSHTSGPKKLLVNIGVKFYQN